MNLTADYHTHTPYSHGKGTVLENATRAKELGLAQIGITDHGFSHIVFGVRRRQVPSLKRECAEAEEKTGVRVLVGMECNIRGRSGLTDLESSDYDDFDLFLCGVHLITRYQTMGDLFRFGLRNYFKRKKKSVPRSLVKETTEAYINTVKNNPVDVLTHVNFQCFADAVEVAKACADHGTYLELSGKKVHFSDEELFRISQTGVRFVLDSDAHSVNRIGDVSLAEEQIVRVGLPLDRIDNIDGRLPDFRFAAFKQKRG